jgi:hypothetical protein
MPMNMVRMPAWAGSTGVALLVWASAAAAQPALEVVGGNAFDLGDVYRGTVATKVLTLRNTGSDTLRIGRVDVSCGCTGTRTSREQIAPGDTASLFITFNSSNFAGPVHKTVTVHTNIPGTESVPITFSGKVVEEISLSVRYLMFQNAKLRETTTSTFRVTNGGTRPLTLLGFRSILKGLKLSLPARPIAPGESAEVTVEFTPEAPAPILTDGVFITTDNAHQGDVYLSIYGNVVDKAGQ